MSTPENLPPLPEGIVATLNAMKGGYNDHLGLTFVSAAYDEVIAEIEIGPQHVQPYGIVHGGVYASMIETLASTGAALTGHARGQAVVGLENGTSFVKAVRRGRIRGVAVPLTRGRRSHLWEVTVRDEGDRLVARGRVRMLCMAQETTVAGEKVGVAQRRPDDALEPR